MAQRDRYSWVKLMMGAVLGILVVDVLVLVVLVVPLRASPQVSAVLAISSRGRLRWSPIKSS